MMTSAVFSSLYDVERLGVLMAPEDGNPLEVEGVLNPAGAVGPDGAYYLFPRLVGEGNYSRIGMVRIVRGAHGRPMGVERLGVALEPEATYEVVAPGVGGCEDARVTYVPCIERYIMAYTALGPTGPHVALASSRDLQTWTRCGLVDFAHEHGVDFNAYFNKDAVVFPEPVRAPDGRLALAMLHRPVYEACVNPDPADFQSTPIAPPDGIEDERPSIWISYCPVDDLAWVDGEGTPRFADHNLVATPIEPWEEYRIGGGTVPIRVPEGWLTFYHGVELYANGDRCYQAGTLLLDHDDPRQVLERTTQPTFGPETDEERIGVVSNVCFPTAIDVRGDGIDIYYGAADSVICCAHLRPAAADVAEVA